MRVPGRLRDHDLSAVAYGSNASTVCHSLRVITISHRHHDGHPGYDHESILGSCPSHLLRKDRCCFCHHHRHHRVPNNRIDLKHIHCIIVEGFVKASASAASREVKAIFCRLFVTFPHPCPAKCPLSSPWTSTTAATSSSPVLADIRSAYHHHTMMIMCISRMSSSHAPHSHHPTVSVATAFVVVASILMVVPNAGCQREGPSTCV